MVTTTRRRAWTLGAALALGLALAALAATDAARGATVPRFGVGNVQCSVVEFSGYGYGLATFFRACMRSTPPLGVTYRP